MKNYAFYGLTISFILLLFAACTRDLDEVTTINNIPTPSVKVSGTFIGLIVDETETPIIDAAINVGTVSTFSDENGFFRLTGLFDTKGSFMTVEKTGFFDAYGRVTPVEDGTVQVKFTLKNNNTSTASSSRAHVLSTDYFLVEFSEDAYQTAENTPYSGEVTINSTFLDPTSDNFPKEYVGNLIGTSNQQTHLIEPIGIINVELFSENGAPLQLQTPAKITMDIPEELRGQVPSEASLWHLDTESGLWIEEGIATLNGNQYEATVEHFTLWCVGQGVLLNSVIVSGQITQQGNPIPNVLLRKTYNFSPIYRHECYADENGNYAMEVLKDREFTIEVLDDCSSILTGVSEPMGLSGDTEIDIAVPLTSNSVNITGTLTDCDNNPVANGYVLIAYSANKFDEVVLTDENGAYELFLETCNTETATIKGFDPVGNLASTNLTITGSGNYDLSTCATAFQGELIISLEGETPYVINNCRFTKERVVFPPGIEFDHYTVKAIDNFSSFPDITGEFADYTLEINLPVIDDGVIPPPSPIIIPETSPNPPVVFHGFGLVFPMQNEVTETLLDVTYEYDGVDNIGFLINRSFGGVDVNNSEESKGTFQIKAILQE